MTEVLEALGVGVAFGFLLQKGGLSRYDRIVNVYRFRDLTVLRFLLSAVVVGACGIRALQALDLATPLSIPSTFLVGNFGGGVIFGVGMALSGFCPGTVAAGIGEGRLDYLVPGVLGLVAGAVGFGFVYPWVRPLLGRGALASSTLPLLLDADPWLVVILLTEVAGIVFVLIDRSDAQRMRPEMER